MATFSGGSDKNQEVLAGNVLQIPLSKQGTTTAKIPVRGILTTEQDLIETPSTEWNNSGWYSFPASPASPFVLSNMNSFTALNGGGFLVAFNHYFTSNPTGQETIFSFRPDDTTNGGWRIDKQSDGDIEIRIRPPGGSLDSYGTMTLGSSWRSKKVSVVIYIDIVNSLLFGYARVQGVVDRQIIADLSGITLPQGGADYVGIGGLAVSGGTVNAGERLGEDNNGTRMSNIIMKRFANDFSPYLPRFLQQFWKINGADLPLVLSEVN